MKREAFEMREELPSHLTKQTGRRWHENWSQPSKKSESSLSSEEPAVSEPDHLILHPLSRESIKFVKRIPENLDFDTTDVPPDMVSVLKNAGLTIVKLDRKGGISHITITDGHTTQRLPHSQIVATLRSFATEQEELMTRKKENDQILNEIKREEWEEARKKMPIEDYRRMESELDTRAAHLKQLYGHPTEEVSEETDALFSAVFGEKTQASPKRDASKRPNTRTQADGEAKEEVTPDTFKPRPLSPETEIKLNYFLEFPPTHLRPEELPRMYKAALSEMGISIQPNKKEPGSFTLRQAFGAGYNVQKDLTLQDITNFLREHNHYIKPSIFEKEGEPQPQQKKKKPKKPPIAPFAKGEDKLDEEATADRIAEEREAFAAAAPEFDENSSIPDLPSHPLYTGAPDLMALDVLENTTNQPDELLHSSKTMEDVDASSVRPHDVPPPFDEAGDRSAQEAPHDTQSGSHEEGPSHSEEGSAQNSEAEPNSQEETKDSAELPEDVQAAMDAVRTQTREELKKINPRAEKPAEPSETFDYRFTSEFNITEEQLMDIDGFEHLSVPQQKLLFENLSQSVYGRIKEEAQKKYTSQADARRAETLSENNDFFAKAWAGVKEVVTKDFNLITAEKEIASQHKRTGIEEHRPMLELLVRSMARSGPRVHETPEGELLVDVVNVRQWATGAERKNQKFAAEEVNRTAHAFAKVPDFWKERTLGVHDGKEHEWKITSIFKNTFFTERKQGNQYAEKEAAFERAKKELAASLERGGARKVEILQTLLDIDNKVKQLQFVQTSPDAVKELSTIEDKSVWYGAAKALIKSPGVLSFGLGFVARSALGVLPGVIGAPIVSSGLAAIRSWNKTGAELRERDRRARMGVADASREALNVVPAEGKHGLIAKTESLLQSFYVLQMAHERALGEGDSDTLELVEKEQRNVLGRLRARVEYIRDKEGLGRIQYGAGPDSYTTHSYLLEILGEASLIIEELQAPENERLAAKLDKYLAVKETGIKKARQSYRRRDLKKQAMKAVAFSLAGAALAHITDVGAGEIGKRNTEGLGQISDELLGIRADVSPQTSVDTIPAETIKELMPYTIKKGDTLLEIAAREIPGVGNMEQSELLNRLRSLTPEELTRVGLRNDNIDRIYAGDALNVKALGALLNGEGGIALDSVPNEVYEGAYDTPDITNRLNRESVITEGVISNEVPETVEVREEVVKETTVDLVTKKKAEILGTYFVRTYLPESWKGIASVEARSFINEAVRGTVTKGAPTLEFGRILGELAKPPFKLVPFPKENVDDFTKRFFLEVVKHEKEFEYPQAVRELYQKIEKSASFTQ